MVAFSLNECYFANQGAALVLGGEGGAAAGRGGGAGRGPAERRRSPARAPPPPEIQHHLQAMFFLLRPEETLKMAVKLESAHAGRTRYLVVVGRGDEAALLGIDCNERTSVGLVLRVLADTSIKLDGDGGFSVCVCGKQHIFKPVSVQAMWSALQTLHRASGRARELNHFPGGTSHTWAAYYEERVDSDRSCLNEWNAMDCLESRRPPSPDSLRVKPRERDETERVIRCTLKEIMMSVDLDEVTSKAIRGRLEDELNMDLAEYKSFIDQEMLTILGQMDAPTEIFDHVYLGSEWNASNLEELQRNGVRHILNVTREIDNFFPGMFDYLNVRVYDDDKTDLLKHWDNTFKYINKARNEGSKVLVHCKMGISRSASVVIAYAMKAYNWNFDKALKHVKTKRSCIKPNNNFCNQLETYQGILDAMKNKEKLQRSKSETNLKSPKSNLKAENKVLERLGLGGDGAATRRRGGGAAGGGGGGTRPRSWSPDSRLAAALLPPTSVSLEHLAAAAAAATRHMLMPCAGGTYSVSPNQIIRLKEEGAPSVKHIVNEIENAVSVDRRDFTKRYQRLNFGSQTDNTNKTLEVSTSTELPIKPLQVSPLRNLGHKYSNTTNAEPERIHTWDPGEPYWTNDNQNSDSDNIVKSDSGIVDVKARLIDAIPDLVERNVGYKKQMEGQTSPPSRQSSCSSFDSAVVADLSRQGSRVSGRLADNERRFRETCALLRGAAGAVGAAGGAWSGRLAASAPAGSWLRGGPRRRRLAAASQPDLRAPAGLVTNRKKEFEARCEGKARSLPAERAPPAEELCVRDLVDRYDKHPRCEPCDKVKTSQELLPKKCRLSGGGGATGAAPFVRTSLCGDRPPVPPGAALNFPNVVVSTVMSKAQNKKQLQHGKTHPLTRLNANRSNNRCSNPVYNTM